MFRVYFFLPLIYICGSLWHQPAAARESLWRDRSWETFSWVALHREETLPLQPTPRSRDQEIDFNKLHLFSNITDLKSTVTISMRFQNRNQWSRSYYQFMMRMSDTARISSVKIDHMGYKTSGRVMRQSRAERLLRQMKRNCSSSGIVMMRTSPYSREFDVYVFLSPGSRMNFDLGYKEQLQTLLADDLFEQIISVYPYQIVEDFQMDAAINRPSSGLLDEVTAFWDSFSVSSTLLDPWGLQREPLSIRPWRGGQRINLSPTIEEMQSPRSWQSDLIIFLEWESRGDWGFDHQTTWNSQSSSEDEYQGSDWLSSSDAGEEGLAVTTDTRDTLVTSITPITSSIVTSTMTSHVTREVGSGMEGSGSGDDIDTDEGSGSGEGESLETQTVVSDLATTTGRKVTNGREATEVNADRSDRTPGTTEDFEFVEDAVTEANDASREEGDEGGDAHFKIYQKETSLEFSLPSADDSSEESDSKFMKVFKRIMKRLFTPSNHEGTNQIIIINGKTKLLGGD